MKAHVLLADAAQPDGMGKVGALGLGWSVTSTPTPPHAVILALRVSWAETSTPHSLELALVTETGAPVLVPGTGGRLEPLKIEAEIEVSRPADRPEGLDIDHNIAINIGPGLALQAGQLYEWRLSLDKEHDPDWSAPFYIRS